MSAPRTFTDGDYRTEVKRVRKALQRLGRSTDLKKATTVMAEIRRLAEDQWLEAIERLAEQRERQQI
jgi:hypothetical protein